MCIFMVYLSKIHVKIHVVPLEAAYLLCLSRFVPLEAVYLQNVVQCIFKDTPRFTLDSKRYTSQTCDRPRGDSTRA